MGRCRFVEPGTVRVYLAEVHERALADLKIPKKKKATKAEIVAAEQALAEARADGAWVDLNRELTAGQANDLLGDMVAGGVVPGERTMLDPRKVYTAKLVAWIVRWSLEDAQGEAVEVSESAIRQLDQQTFNELVAAVDWHAEHVEGERSARKNAQAGGSASSPTSGSLSELDGQLTSSAH